MKNIMVVLIMAVMVCGCTVEKEGGKEMARRDHESKTVHCIGRSVVELPNSFVASPIATGVFKNRKQGEGEPIDVLVRTVSDPSIFAGIIQKHKAELEAASSPNVDILREVKELGDNATIFHIQRIDDAFVSEIFFMREKNIVSARLHSFRNQYASAERTLVRFADKVKAIDGSLDPRQVNGFCMGKVAIFDDFEIERSSFLYRNDLGEHFEIDVNTFAKDDRVTLLERMSGPDSLLKMFDVPHTVFRAREKTVAGMRAQEWLGSAQVTEDEGEKAFQFTMETMRPLPSKTFPRISLTFETAQPLEDGRQTKTVISKDDAIRLWDSVVDSLRSTHPLL